MSNNAFLMSTPLYLQVLAEIWGNSTDPSSYTEEEWLVSKVSRVRGLSLCFVSGSFGIHPAYKTQAGQEAWEDWAVRRVMETLQSHQV